MTCIALTADRPHTYTRSLASISVDTSLIFDYALVFQAPNAPDGYIRIDLTIIPKVFRNANANPDTAETLPSAFLCRPDGNEMTFKLSTAVKDYVPQQGSCAAHTNRTQNAYALIDSTYAGAHPEEKDWLDGRLAVTGPKVQDFVFNKLQLNLTDAQAKLKIAVVHSGGGKRAMLQSLGTCVGCCPLKTSFVDCIGANPVSDHNTTHISPILFLQAWSRG
jgi:hypothetical protein